MIRSMIKELDRRLAIAIYVGYYVINQPCEAARNLAHFICTGKPRG